MRCIEINSNLLPVAALTRINRNMRCIEMINSRRYIKNDGWINRNMRCIEILVAMVPPLSLAD